MLTSKSNYPWVCIVLWTLLGLVQPRLLHAGAPTENLPTDQNESLSRLHGKMINEVIANLPDRVQSIVFAAPPSAGEIGLETDPRNVIWETRVVNGVAKMVAVSSLTGKEIAFQSPSFQSQAFEANTSLLSASLAGQREIRHDGIAWTMAVGRNVDESGVPGQENVKKPEMCQMFAYVNADKAEDAQRLLKLAVDKEGQNAHPRLLRIPVAQRRFSAIYVGKGRDSLLVFGPNAEFVEEVLNALSRRIEPTEIARRWPVLRCKEATPTVWAARQFRKELPSERQAVITRTAPNINGIFFDYRGKKDPTLVMYATVDSGDAVASTRKLLESISDLRIAPTASGANTARLDTPIRNNGANGEIPLSALGPSEALLMVIIFLGENLFG